MRFLFVAGIILFLGSFFLIGPCYDKFKVERDGHLVRMQIKKLPNSCIGAKIRYSVTFSYGTEIYSKQMRGDFCEKHYAGEQVDVKMLEGSKYILLPNESALFSLISCVGLGFLGLILSIVQWKR